MHHKHSLVPYALAACAWLGLSIPALSRAGLGDTTASVSSDSHLLNASLRVASHGSYTVHEMQTPTGTIVREFVAPSGTVFAVAWKGPFKPNLAVLMGRYYGTYAIAARAPGTARTQMRIERPDMVVHAGGHVRHFEGIAYLPALLPAHVTEGELH